MLRTLENQDNNRTENLKSHFDYFHKIHGRKSIRNYSMQTDIQKKHNTVLNETDEIDFEENNEQENKEQIPIEQNLPLKPTNKKWTIVGLIIITICIFNCYSFFVKNSTVPIQMNVNQLIYSKLKQLKSEFPNQDKHIWYSFSGGLSETIQFDKPSVYILASKNVKTVENLAKKLSKIINEVLSFNTTGSTLNNNNDLLELRPEDLNVAYYLNNNGRLIENYREKLKQIGSLIVYNIENVSGRVATVFHSFCDDVTPLVNKSVIIFTFELGDTDEFNEETVFNYLSDRWKYEIEDEILHALLTRITGAVLNIHPE